MNRGSARLCGQTTAGFALEGWLELTHDVDGEGESRIAEGLIARSMAVSGEPQTEVRADPSKEVRSTSSLLRMIKVPRLK
jgi:hypothetical protein